MTRRARAAAGLFGILTAAGSIAGDRFPHGTTVVRASRLLDVKTGHFVPDVAILVRMGRIEAVGPAARVPAPSGATILDLPGATLLPGLIDAHVHLAWGPSPAAAPAGAEDAATTLLAGFTTVRNPGSTHRADLLLRDAIEEGRVPGPRILAAGPGLGAPGGVCEKVFGPEAAVHGPAAAAARVRRLVESGVDLIKVCAGGGVLATAADEETAELTEEEIRAIVQEAHGRGRRVAAHAQGSVAIQRAARAGVDSIEHGSLLDAPTARLLREKRVLLVPTLYRLEWVEEQARRDASQANAAERLGGARALAEENVRRAIAAGVPIVLGTDATVTPHGLNARELRVLVRLGLSPLEALRSATTRAAELIGWSDRVGSLERGKFADVIAVEGDPLVDVSVLERVKFVMKGGRVYRNDLHPERPSSPGDHGRASPPHAGARELTRRPG